MPDHDQYAFGVLGVLMRREGLTSVHITYDELCAEPIQLMFEETADGSVTVTLPTPDQMLSEDEIEILKAEACAAGETITRSFGVRAPSERN